MEKIKKIFLRKKLPKQFNITGSVHGSFVYAKNIREAKKIFRQRYKSEKIIYSGLLGKINLRKMFL